MPSFIDRLCEAIVSCKVEKAETRRVIGRAIADTISVALAGACEKFVRDTTHAYQGTGPSTWSGDPCDSRESVVFLNALAGHALDFDDCYLASLIHPSTVILPAIFSGDGTDKEDDLIDAFGAGLITGRAVAERLGFGHYRKGWHGTGTVGAFAAAGAAAKLYGLDRSQLKSAMALVAAQAGGLHLNFGTFAKPAQAGFAAANGYRAVRLAKAGVDGSQDIFEQKKGFVELYGGEDASADPDELVFQVRADQIALKLFPSCYQSHRLIGVALDARKALDAKVFMDPATRIRLEVPANSIESLLYPHPKRGAEGKFSPRFPVAAALAFGPPTLAHFSDDIVNDPAILELGGRLEIVEDESQQSKGDMEFGVATLSVDAGDRRLGSYQRHFLPGSPQDPPSDQALGAKFASCVRVYEETFGKRPSIIEACRGIPSVWGSLRLAVNETEIR